MKILHVIPSAAPARGGPSFVLKTIVRGLAERGAEVHVACTDDNGNGRLRVPLEIPVNVDGGTFRYFQRQTRFYTYSWPLTRWLTRHIQEFDLVHIHALFSYPSTMAALCCQWARVPYVLRPLGTLSRWGMRNRRPLLKRVSFRFIEGQLLRRAAAVHCTSQQEADEAVESLPNLAIKIIPNPVDLPSTIGQVPARRSSFTVLFLSRIDRKKGLSLLLRAFAKVRTEGVRLLICGDGDATLIRKLRAHAAELGISESITWCGFVEGAEKTAILRGADIFVLPSYSENFGVSVVEAMNHGLPVIVSDQVGIHHEITAAGAGLVTPCSEDSLANALSRMILDPILRAQAGRSAQALGLRFAPEAVIAQLLDLYRDVISHSRTQVAYGIKDSTA